MKIKTILKNFIPIILLFILLSYTEPFIRISGTVLGKLFAIFIILFYTSIDIIHGIMAAGLIIIYYQSDIVETMLSLYEDELQKQYDSTIQSEPVNESTLLVSNTALSYVNQYENSTKVIPSSDETKSRFRNNRCRRGHLVIKGQKIPIDMTNHVYPEVSFINDKCNICDSTCDFTVSNNIINTSKMEGFASISGRI